MNGLDLLHRPLTDGSDNAGRSFSALAAERAAT